MKKENNEEKIKENEAGITDENEVKEAKEEKPAKDKKKDKSDGEIEKLRQELADKEDKYLRLYAEYDNFRKRSQKEKADIYSIFTVFRYADGDMSVALLKAREK